MKYISNKGILYSTGNYSQTNKQKNPKKTRLKISRSLELFACTKIWHAFSFKKED